LCTTAIDCEYGRDAVLAIVASLLWFVAAEFVAYFMLVHADTSSREKSASITPASPNDADDVVDIYLHDDGIPSIIATTTTTTTTTTATTTNNNNNTNRHGHADDIILNHSMMSIEEAADFDDGISALELPVIGPSIRYPVYDQHQHEDVGGRDGVCYMYPSPPPSIHSLSSLSRNQVFDYDASSSSRVVNNNNNNNDDDDADSFGNMYLTEGAPPAVSMLSEDLLVPSLTMSSSYTYNEQEEEEEEKEEATDGLSYSNVLLMLANQIGSNDADDEEGADEIATL
jgi:hypothetical protein